jgi:2-hydroxychromene-2-carboxylate isomerase
MGKTLRFYFDYISTNAYLAWLQMPIVTRRHGFLLEPVPVLFAGLLEAHGTSGPAETPAKALWMWKNNLRKAALSGVSLNPPAFHPFNPLLALRVTSLASDYDEHEALITRLFEAVWVRGEHVSEPEVVERAARDVGLDGAALVAEASSDAAKARLRRQTDEAIARGVFGVPTMEANGEIFWGYDDLPYLETFLAGDDPLARTAFGKSDQYAPRPSAMRRQHRARVERDS